MTGAGPLERGYRRLLVFYPAPYRRIHEEEVLAVLMTAAPGGKRRPGIAEAADLILGALRVRCQPQRDGAAGPAWRDALAVLSVILPVIFLLIDMVQETQMLLSFPAPGAFSYGLPCGLSNSPPPRSPWWLWSCCGCGAPPRWRLWPCSSGSHS